eukprot:5994726-Pyramimonas_sp.AAC.1
MAVHAHAQGEWRSSMTIVPLALRLSAAACSPLFPNFRHLAHLRHNNRQRYQQMPELNNKNNRKQTVGIKPRKIPKLVEEGNDDCENDLKGLGCSTYYTDALLDSVT